jgi:ubiquinone/menaquinone biosynthesis C-methylase UbiE
MLRAAKARLAHLDNVDLRSGSLEALPVDDGALDVAVLSLVLHFIADPAAALAGIRRALRARGGRLLLVDMAPHDHAEYRQTMGHVWLGFDGEQLERWGTAAGFSSTRYHVLPASPQAKGPTLFTAVLTT